MWLSTFLANRDMFGSPIQLQIGNGHGDALKSVPSGICSILVNLLVLAYMITKINSMMQGNLDNIIKYEQGTDFDEVGNFTMGEGAFVPIIQIVYKDEEVLEYIDIKIS